MKHAYLIIAHNEFEILSRLLQAIDNERNDIYIHFDRKLKNCPAYKTWRARLYILTDRIDVRWGDVSVVQAEYALFAEAYSHGIYSYYHLLSGVDMPLKSQDYIHDFFERNAGKEFIGYYQGDATREIDRKVNRWHLFPKSFKEIKGVLGIAKRSMRAGYIRLQQNFGIRRNRSVNFKKGTQWVSITDEFVFYLLQQREEIFRIYSHTFCADEIFIQTLCWNSPFRNNIYDKSNEGHGCLRMIGWKDNQLKEWQEKDFDLLMSSEALFARKFSSRHIRIVDKILKEVVC